MRGLAVQNCFARRTIEGDLEVIHEASASPHGTRPKPQTIYQQFGDKRVLAAECGCEVFDERVEESIARFRFDALDDLAQRRVVGRGSVPWIASHPSKKDSASTGQGLCRESILVPIRSVRQRE